MIRTRTLLTLPLLLAAAPAAARTVTLQEAVDSTRTHNVTWQSLAEFLVQTDAAKGIGWGLFFPKLRAEGQWLHLGERNVPNIDMGVLSELGPLLGDVIGAVIEEHPGQAGRFLPYLDSMQGSGADSGGNAFESFVPPRDTFSATFSLVVPIINPTALPFLRGAYDQHDAMVQRVGHGREQLLYAVAKAYYGLLTLQNMVAVAERSIEAAQQHFRSNQVKASLQAVTELQVKRAELEVTSAERQRAELVAALEKGKAAFRYLTGLEGTFELVDPALPLGAAAQPLAHWQETAESQRKDLTATRLEVNVSDHEVGKVIARYFPTVNFIAQGKIDNAKEQRFDDDPYSWNLLGVLSWDLFDGGIREREMQLARSRLRQAKLAQEDLDRKIDSEVQQSYQGLLDAATARQLAERQLDVAKATQDLVKVSEQAGVVTNLEVIDVNTMVFASEAQALAARLQEAMATLDLLAASGMPPPFTGTEPAE